MPGFLIIGSEAHPAALRPGQCNRPSENALFDGHHVWVHLDGEIHALEWRPAIAHFEEDLVGDIADTLRAPMPGAVIAVHVESGAVVRAGETMLLIESMKLETAIKAPRDGIVAAIHVRLGQSFDRDVPLVSLEELAA